MSPLSSLRVVYLTNFLAPDLEAVCEAIDQQVGEFTVLASVAMERNRPWQPAASPVEVRLQHTWTWTRQLKHPQGYQDVNYVHLPLDTPSQLRALKPDVVVSAELGFRSIAASLYRRAGRYRHIIAVSLSEHTERNCGTLRRRLRRWLLRRADLVTCNGPSATRYVEALGIDTHKIRPWNYACHPQRPYRGVLQSQRPSTSHIRLLTVGQLIERKGVLEAQRQLAAWARQHPECSLEWTVAGDGPLRPQLEQFAAPANLKCLFLGNIDANQMRKQYEQHELLLFPTMGDEWGLVVDEALASGLVVIGSRFSQAVETLINERQNGWNYCPTDPIAMSAALDAWLTITADERLAMRQAARRSVEDRTPEHSARQLLAAIESLTSSSSS